MKYLLLSVFLFLSAPLFLIAADQEQYFESIGMLGVGGGYTGGFIPHKDLRSYESNGGYFAQLGILGNYFNLVYHRDYLELEQEIVDKYQITNPVATLGRLTIGFNIPIPIIGEEDFALAPTINYGLGGYRFVLPKEAYDKLGGNLTKLHNKDLKFGQYVGIGLTMTILQRINLNFTWNVDWVVKDYKGWYLITSSLVPLFIDEADTFTKAMIGISFMFGKTLMY